MGEVETQGLLPTWVSGVSERVRNESKDNDFVGSPEGSLKKAGGPMDVFGGSRRTHEKFADEKGAWKTAFAPPVVLCARVAAGGGWEHVWGARF